MKERGVMSLHPYVWICVMDFSDSLLVAYLKLEVNFIKLLNILIDQYSTNLHMI
jgi:hypothetical protein